MITNILIVAFVSTNASCHFIDVDAINAAISH